MRYSVLPATFSVTDIAKPTFNAKFFEKISKSELQNRIANNEIEPLDAHRRIYRMTQKWRSSACTVFSAAGKSGQVSLHIPSKLRAVMGSEITRVPMRPEAV